MGDRPEPLSVPSAGRVAEPPDGPPQNSGNYRITSSDRLGAGSLWQKCQDNLTAIELLKRLEKEQRPATEEERKALVRFVGWGGLPQVFDELNEGWQKERARLAALLTERELESARATTLNAHYTAPVVIEAMYAALRRFGFEHGRIVEPACGLGHFIGLMPDSMHRRSSITGVEIDSLTARLARQLYPDSDIRHQPFEECRLPDSYFDLAISNVPFGDHRPFDPRFKQWRFLIHDYFFAATLERLRPGGLLLFVTSKGTLDKKESGLRELLSQKADLLGAIRLPNDAFKRNANTEVTTDIVMLRKRLPGELPREPSWKALGEITNSLGETIPVNEYFVAHPEMMLGEMRLEGRMYRRHEPTLVGSGRALEEQLAEAVARLPQDVFRSADRPAEFSLPRQGIPSETDLKPNAYTIVNDRIGIREGDQIVALENLSHSRSQRIRGLIRVREAVRRCLRSQLESPDDAVPSLNRRQLNDTYEEFVGRFGPISERINTSAFRGDPDLPLLLSLEHYNPETKETRKAAIFRERTIRPLDAVVQVDSAKDALLLSLGERGRVDLPHIGSLLNRTAAEVEAELQGAIFLNPQSNHWETEDAYLSGNVRAKLAVAEAASLIDGRFRTNVEALKQVQPIDLNASEIDARLGGTWIPPNDIVQFIEELLGERGISVNHVPQLGLWVVQGDWNVKRCVANTTEWGTDRRSALELVEDALNLRTPTIYDRDEANDRDVINATATEAVRDKQEKIKERFKGWLWQEDERRERLVLKYNQEFNHLRGRVFNGAHLRLPGANPTIQLRPHQKAAIWRILQTQNCLLAHVVGAGKTFTLVAAAMELKRLGLSRKPLITVPNHMLGQFSTELLALYPSANILVATKEDFETEKRKTLMSRIATGSWDAVIITHSGFEKIPLSRTAQEEFIQSELRDLSLAIEQQRGEHGSRIVKMLERAKKKLESRLKELLAEDRKDDCLTFEELGVDRLLVDEAHAFKNLFYVSKMTRIAGLPQTASQRAFDMFLKVRHVQRINGGVVFATGTPIANSVAEMFTMQRYLQMTSLRDLKVDHFDSWAATFGEPVTAMELSPDGAGYRLNTRFARFINVPELMQQFRQVTDIQTAKMLDLPVPKLKSGKPIIINAPVSPELKEVVQSLVQRAEALRSGRIDPRTDNMLLVTTDGRKAALDLRLYRADLPDHADSKVNRAADQIAEIWRESSESRATQIVFCDLSTPTGLKGFSVYDDLRTKLISRGIAAEEIAFIQDHDSDAAKLALFRDVREGRIRVLIGSTQKMGTGVNVQQRLIALHHLDAPWRPADVEQRDGRILRQGNIHPEVGIYRYVTEGSFDAYMWQTLETKARFIAQVMNGSNDLRRIEDIDGAALTYAEVKAIASGNPMVIEKAEVDAELARLSRLRTQHRDTQFRLRSEARRWTDEIPRLEKRLGEVRADMAAAKDTRGDQFVIQIDGQTIRDRGIAGELLARHAERIKGRQAEKTVGAFAGFELVVADNFMGVTEILLKGSTTHRAKLGTTAQGTMRSVEHAVQSLGDAVAELEARAQDARKRVTEFSAQIGQPFEYEDRLAELAERHRTIIEALDLTKNQTSARLASEAVDRPTEES